MTTATDIRALSDFPGNGGLSGGVESRHADYEALGVSAMDSGRTEPGNTHGRITNSGSSAPPAQPLSAQYRNQTPREATEAGAETLSPAPTNRGLLLLAIPPDADLPVTMGDVIALLSKRLFPSR